MSLPCRLREAFLDNHYLRHTMQTGTVYTWKNISLVFVAGLLLVVACIRVHLYRESLPFISVMEPESQLLMTTIMRVPDYWLLDARNADQLPKAPNLGNQMRIVLSDAMYMALPTVLHVAIFAGGLLANGILLIMARRKRWNSPFQEELRILPFTPLQFLVARYDVIFLRYWLLLLFGALLLLLPARNDWGQGFGFWKETNLTVNASTLLVTVMALLFWFAIWRTALCVSFCRYQIPYLMMLAAWVPMFLWLCVLFYYSLNTHKIGDITTISLWSTFLLVLAIPCAMGVYISPRILAWEEEPKQYHLSVLVRKVI